MEILVLLGLILGLGAGVAVTNFLYRRKNEKQLQTQSTILLEKIRQVCKLITVEGEFSEIFAHRDEKSMFFKLWQSEKKALVIIKAKVLIGFDLTKINIETDSDTKQVKLSQFPDAEILSIETDLEYYDIQKGMINKFSEADLTNVNKNAKDFIREKVNQSQLFTIAQHQANETIALIQQLIESVGWELVSRKMLENSSNVLSENNQEEM